MSNLIEEITRRIADPGSYVTRGDNYHEPITQWGARAVELLFQQRDKETAESIATISKEVTRLNEIIGNQNFVIQQKTAELTVARERFSIAECELDNLKNAKRELDHSNDRLNWLRSGFCGRHQPEHAGNSFVEDGCPICASGKHFHQLIGWKHAAITCGAYRADADVSTPEKYTAAQSSAIIRLIRDEKKAREELEERKRRCACALCEGAATFAAAAEKKLEERDECSKALQAALLRSNRLQAELDAIQRYEFKPVIDFYNSTQGAAFPRVCIDCHKPFMAKHPDYQICDQCCSE